ncbi:MAG: sulfur carrier protein ThiS [Phycisphaerae bacterium]|nr:sulfur carrier protein ThiS [Phycisphaerae bacterium]NUQ47673.1 sulfur carrier protein ThiS [Phycisphaerae bacterium]
MADESIEIVLNGQSEHVRDGISLQSLIKSRGPRPPFAVEVNKRLVRRPEYDRVFLGAGDHVEIVTLVGGG